MFADAGGAGPFGVSSQSGVPGYSAAELSDLGSVATGPGITRQEFAKETDINEIMSRFGADVLRVFGTKKPMYGDFTGIEDFDSALAKVQDVEERFRHLPVELRTKVGNDPGRFLRVVQGMSEEEFDDFVRVQTPAPPAAAPVPAPVAPVVPPVA